MKNSALFFAFLLLMVGCSSGTTVSDLPQNVTSRFVGTFLNTPNTQSGTVTLDLSETNGTVTGNAIFESGGANCLRNATVSGTNTGFNMNLTAAQVSRLYTIVIELREPDIVTTTPGTPEVPAMGTTPAVPAVPASSTSEPGDVISTRTVTSTGGAVGETTTTLSNGNVEMRTTTVEDVTGTLTMQFAVGNSGNSLNGTYVVTGDGSVNSCSNATGSGTMTLNR